MEITENKNIDTTDFLADLGLSDVSVNDLETETEANPVVQKVVETANPDESVKVVDESVSEKTIQQAPSLDIKSLSTEFAIRLLVLQKQKKTVDYDIKQIKQDYAERGVAVNQVMKALANTQKRKKMSQSQLDELDTLQALFENSLEIEAAIKDLEDI